MKKNIYWLLLGLFSILSACSLKPAYFPEAALNAKQDIDPKIRDFTQGIYWFKVCVRDTFIIEQRVGWFCDCNNNNDAIVVDSVAMIFIDSYRVLLTKKAQEGQPICLDCPYRKIRKLQLNDPCKLTKVGMYNWLAPDSIGRPRLKIRIRSPKVGKGNDWADLHFTYGTKGDFVFSHMDYPTNNSNIENLLPKKNSNISELNKKPDAGLYRINYQEFAFTHISFEFEPIPISLTIKGQRVLSINTDTGSLIRTSLFTNGALLKETLTDSSSIKTW